MDEPNKNDEPIPKQLLGCRMVIKHYFTRFDEEGGMPPWQQQQIFEEIISNYRQLLADPAGQGICKELQRDYPLFPWEDLHRDI